MNKLKIILEPVVHEDVWLPEVGGRHPDVLHVVVLRGVPPHVGVRPLLRHHLMMVRSVLMTRLIESVTATNDRNHRLYSAHTSNQRPINAETMLV